MFIIWGSKGKESIVASGLFHCPSCGGQADYIHKRVDRYFTLYWIPLFKTATLGEFIHCQRCGGDFNTRVLDSQPQIVPARASGPPALPPTSGRPTIPIVPLTGSQPAQPGGMRVGGAPMLSVAAAVASVPSPYASYAQAVRTDLQAGVPLQAVYRKLLDAGLPASDAQQVAAGACGGRVRTCGCRLIYTEQATGCSVCGTSLQNDSLVVLSKQQLAEVLQTSGGQA